MDLQVLWFCLLGFFFAAYFVLEGFDFGVGLLLPFLPRNEEERSTMFRTIGPVWDGNEVWLVIAGASMFAAFPDWYATMFSGFYIALLLLLVFLIVRVLSFEWRERDEQSRWRGVWAWANTIGSLGAALIWGVAFSNLLYGVPINSSGDFDGTFWDLFNLYTLLGGVAVVLLFAFHGATYLTLRTTGELCRRAATAAGRLSIATAVVGAGFLIWTVAVAVDRNDKDVFPPLLPALLAIAALLGAAVCVRLARSHWAFVLTAAGAALLVATIFTSLYPRVMVASNDFANSLTVDNAASEHYTLKVMTVVALIVTPVILLYQAWTYHVFRARLGGKEVGSPIDLFRGRAAPSGVPLLDPRLAGRTTAVRRLLVADVVLGVAAALLVLGQAVLIARVAARSFDGAGLAAVQTSLLLLLAVVAGRAAAAWGFEALGRRAATDVVSALRLELVERRLGGQPAALDGAASAEVATTAVGGAAALEATFARYLPLVVLAAVVPVAVLALVAWVDLVSAGVMLLTLPLVPVFMWLVGRYTERRTRERRDALALLATHFLDVVRGLPTLRAFNRGEAQAARIAEVGDRYRTTTMETLRVAFLSGAVLELAATLGIALVAVTVGVRLVQGGLGLEAGLTVLVLAPELYLPLRNLAAQFHASAEGRETAARLLDLAESAPAGSVGVELPPSPAEAPIRLEQVSFSYPARPVPVLESFDLELAPGETVALVGSSGAGKSTIAALLLKLVQPTAGRVTVGGVDLASCDDGAWRAQVAWVPQRPTLFRGTVADNIRLGDAEADDAHVREAAVQAGADPFVRGLPAGYDTVVGEGGRQLSAGQLQRLALARAFLRDAPFVVLDEPTANLDAENAELVADAIERLRGGRTVFLAVHEPRLAALADRIVRIEDGGIAEGVTTP